MTNKTFIPSVFVQSLVAPPIKDTVGEILTTKEGGKGSFWTLDKSLSPADLYIYLKTRFGPPNGFTMVLRAPNTDNFIQWHYTLKSGSSSLNIFGLNTRTDLMISKYPNLGVDDWAELIVQIKNDFKRFKPELKEIRGGLEKWQLFYNPFHRLNTIVSKYYDELLMIINESLELPNDPSAFPLMFIAGEGEPKEDISEFNDQMQSVSEQYRRAQEISTSLRLICPVWGESFINFIIFFLLRPEIKKDRRQYLNFIRRDIDLRIKELSMYCVGFNEPVDTDNRKFKDFQSIMNERNDLLHGNIDPERLSYETIYFDDTIPLFTEPQSLSNNSLGVSLVGIEPEETLKRVDIVRSFIEFILNHLEDSIKAEVIIIMNTRDLGWREDAQRLGILFPDYVAEGFLR